MAVVAEGSAGGIWRADSGAHQHHSLSVQPGDHVEQNHIVDGQVISKNLVT
jgi:hypothetical protein